MSIGPSNPARFDLFQGNGTTTGTRAEPAITLPPGKKAIAVTLVTSATCTVKIQNSVDSITWFDVSSSTVSTVGANGTFAAEVESAFPLWRVQVSAHTTSGTGNIMYATICQSMVGN